jgi:hypothetical protein
MAVSSQLFGHPRHGTKPDGSRRPFVAGASGSNGSSKVKPKPARAFALSERASAPVMLGDLFPHIWETSMASAKARTEVLATA